MGFTRLIIGFIFIFFNFNVVNVNILPDFIGYIFFYFGAVSLTSSLNSHHFTVVKKASKILIILSAIEAFIRQSTVLSNVLNDVQAIHEKFFALFFLLTIESLYIYCFYSLFKGIEEEANNIEDFTLSLKSKKILKLMLFFNVIAIIPLLGILLHGNSEVNFTINAGTLFIIVFLIAIFYVFIKVVSLLRHANEVFYRSKQ